MATTTQTPAEICQKAKAAAHELAQIDGATRAGALLAIADALVARSDEVLEHNARDLEAGEQAALSPALLDRLKLDHRRIAAIAAGARQVAGLPDPVGELVGGRRLANGLELRQLRVPLGVVAVVYEARPNVTIDAAALCLMSGNACVLRGSSSAANSNAVLAVIAAQAATGAGLPAASVSLIAGGGRDELAELATQEGVVDLIIPRGGEGLKAAIKGVATVPVIYAASGNCHVYVDAGADVEKAVAIALNAKTHRPGVCNAAETLLVHRDVAAEFLPRALRELDRAGVELRVDARTRSLAGAELSGRLHDAGEGDWATEFLALVLAVGVVDTIDEAIAHIGRFGSGHSEAIVTRDLAAAQRFERGVDAACVYVNASTRFTDGGEFGMGMEIANSTQKLHARGPIGLRELCTTKYVVTGDGHVRV